MGDYLWQILRHICLHIKLYQIPLENSLFIYVLGVGRCIHDFPGLEYSQLPKREPQPRSCFFNIIQL